jgi:hypothetical protein
MLATPVSNKMELFCKLGGLLEHRNGDVQSEHAWSKDMQTRKTKVIGKVLWLCRLVRVRWVHGEEKDEFITVYFSGPKAMNDISDPGGSALSLLPLFDKDFISTLPRRLGSVCVWLTKQYGALRCSKQRRTSKCVRSTRVLTHSQ